MRWIYAKIGEPMWEWTEGPVEQAVMFYDADSRTSRLPPPMTDADWKRLDTSLRNQP
jgi:hypothetical protein